MDKEQTQQDVSQTPAEQPPEQQQINLVEAITNILVEAGHGRPSDWQRKVDKTAFETDNQNFQRFLINRGFHLILGGVVTEDTMNARYCLVDTGSIDDYLRLFKTEVAPILVRANVPAAIN